MATKPPELASTVDAAGMLSLGERAAIGRIEKALFGGDDRLVEVGRYRIVALIGSGSFGKVYRAHDPELARDVALKVTAAAVADRDELMREARVMATIRHPNVAAVHDAGIVETGVFIAMELVTGTTVRDWLATPRPRAAIVDVLCQAGRGLAAAHAAGIVHRDFKPDNVLVDRSGRAQVIDFGLARAVTGADARVAGTPAYMAPELLARGIAPAVGGRAATISDSSAGGTGPVARGDGDSVGGSDSVARGDGDSVGGSDSVVRGDGHSVGGGDSVSRGRVGGGDSVGDSDSMAPGGGDSVARGGVDSVGGSDSVGGRTDSIARGPAGATPASDQFAFAITACEAIAGARPFAGTTLAELRAALDQPPSLPRDRLRAILARALARDPAARFPSVAELVDAIAAREAKRSRWWIPAVAAAITAGAVAIVATRDEAGDPCPRPVAELAGTWDPATRETMAKAMHALPRGDQVFARVSATLDRATTAWLDARLDACVATAVRHDQSPQMLDRRVACLRGWRRQLAAVTRTLAHPTADTVALAPRTIGELPPLARCNDADALASDAPGDDADSDALGDARAALAAGHPDDALDIVRTLPGSVAAAMLEADALVAAARFDEARDAARRAFDAAIAASDKRTAARAASVIAFVGSYDPSRVQEWLPWVASGTKLIATLDDTLELEARLANAEGNLELAAGVAPAARTALQRAVTDFTKLDPDHWALGSSLAALGAAEQDLGELDAAERDLRAGLARVERDLGPQHVEVATTLINVGLVEGARGHYRDATTSFDRAMAILTAAGGATDARLAYAYLDRSQVASARGDRAAAERDLDDADRIASATFGARHPFTAQIAMVHAAVLADAGDPHALEFADRAYAVLSTTDALTSALAQATRARALAAAGKLYDGIQLAAAAGATADALPTAAGAIRGLIYQAYGELSLAAGHRATAEPQLRAALAAFAASAPDPLRTSAIRFALARATNDAALARTALDEFPRDGDPTRRAAIETWLVRNPATTK